MRQLKVEVSGFVNTEFVGNDKECFKFLTDLKNQQLNQISEDDLKTYNTETPKLSSRLSTWEYGQKLQTYFNPTINKTNFREKYQKFGLKIKITEIT